MWGLLWHASIEQHHLYLCHSLARTLSLYFYLSLTHTRGPSLTHMLPLSLLSAGSGAAGHVRGREREERARSLPASPRRRSLCALLR